MAKNNIVSFGLRNVHYAKATQARFSYLLIQKQALKKSKKNSKKCYIRG